MANLEIDFLLMMKDGEFRRGNNSFKGKLKV